MCIVVAQAVVVSVRALPLPVNSHHAAAQEADIMVAQSYPVRFVPDNELFGIHGDCLLELEELTGAEFSLGV